MKPRPAAVLLYAALCAALGVVLIGGLRFYWPQTADDSFIFFRYARHFATGHGLTWNVGEAPVEGFSSPFWVFLLTVASMVGASPLFTAKLLGVIFFVGTIVGVGLLAHRISAERWFPFAAMVGVVLLRPLHYWAPSGMETSLYACALVWGVVAIGSRYELAAGFALGAIALARPEGPLLVAGALVALAILRGRSDLRSLAWIAIPAILVTAAYLAFRLVTFHDLLPNTFYAKVGGPLVPRLRTGVEYARYALPLWVACAAFMVLLLRARGVNARARETAAVACTLVSLDLFAIVWGGGDWMWYYRFLGPVFALALPATLGAARALVIGRKRAARGVLGCLVALTIAGYSVHGAGLIGMGEITRGLTGTTISPDWAQEGTLTSASIEVAKFLRSEAPPGATIAVNHAGAVPYYSDLPAIDMTGLNDHHIAHAVKGELHEKYDPEYVLGRDPEFIVLNSRVRPSREGWYVTGYWEGETALVTNPEFGAKYAFLPVYWTWTWQAPRIENYILVARRVHPGQNH